MWRPVLRNALLWFLTAICASLVIVRFCDVDGNLDSINQSRQVTDRLAKILVACCLVVSALGAWITWNRRETPPAIQKTYGWIALIVLQISIGSWFGWNVYAVLQRKALIDALRQSEGRAHFWCDSPNRLNPLRRILRDEHVAEIWLVEPKKSFDKSQLQATFPEARVSMGDPGH